MITKVLTWVLLNYGLTNIVVFSLIFEPVRNFFERLSQTNTKIKWLGMFLSKMTSCPMCFATWSGFFISIIIWSPTHVLFGTPTEFSWFFDGIISSGSVWAINSIIEFFEESRINKNNNE